MGAKGIDESRFHLWRAVVAVIHADHVVSPHEVNYVLEALSDLPLNEKQRNILWQDLRIPLPIDDAFHAITRASDREDFFHLARAVAWADGHFDAAEKAMLARLANAHLTRGEQEAMRSSLQSFQDIYVDEAKDQRDPAIMRLVRHFVGARAA